MRRRNKAKKFKVIFISIALVLCAIFGVLYFVKASKGKTGTPAPIATEKTAEALVPVVENPAPQESKPAQTGVTAKTNSLSIPVFMYHYVRDLNDPNDQIGTNLSVSPQTFASQLDYIKQQGYTTINFNDILSGKIPQKPVILTFDDGYKDFFQSAYPELKKRNMTAVSFVITNKIDSNLYLSKADIKELSSNGIEIGSHTLSHPDLSTLKTASAQKEIVDSKKILEDLIGKKVISFCYPSGKFTSETETLVKEAGYDYAVTTKGGITTFGNAFELNRYRINHDTSIKGYIK